jgi:hypothetical protein
MYRFIRERKTSESEIQLKEMNVMQSAIAAMPPEHIAEFITPLLQKSKRQGDQDKTTNVDNYSSQRPILVSGPPPKYM